MGFITKICFSDTVWLISLLLCTLGWILVLVGTIGMTLTTYIWMYIIYTLSSIIQVVYAVYFKTLPQVRLSLTFQLAATSMLLGTLIQVVDTQSTQYLTFIFVGAVLQIGIHLFWILLIGSLPGTLAYYLSGQADLLISEGMADGDTESLGKGRIEWGPEHVLKVRTHYPYQAASEDEISFDKHEVMQVLNSKGNWWRVLKADGTVGMAPSNYLAVVL